jgi:predicted acyl esterase
VTPYPVLIDRRVFVTMRDGTRIALTVYLPDAPGDGPFPTVVESLPYRKDDDCTQRDYRTFAYLAGRGFAGVRIDIRGTGASTGVIEDEYTAQEQADTLEVFDWVVAQDWSNGNLGMWGVSWGGFSTLQTAMLRPPALKAIAPVHATHDRFACDVHYTGGSLHAAEQVDWPPSMVTTNALPPDPDIVGDVWFEEWMARLESTPQWPFEWLRHQRRDDYWLHGSPCGDYASIQCPTLLIGGWLDGYVDGMLAMAEHLTCPTRAVIGPWGHYRPATGVPAPTLDHFDLLARWFGHHLRGDDNGVMDMPAVTVFVREHPPYDEERAAGRWRAEPAWPPPDAVEARWRLDGLAHSSTSWDGPQWVGAHAPAWDRAGVSSTDPAPDDAVSMTFESGPLEEDLEILGTPLVRLRIASDQDVGMVAARLIAVPPHGQAHLVCRGSRNLAFPKDLSLPEPVQPGMMTDIEFPLMVTSAVIPAGWSLRLALSGADFPVVWPPGKRFRLDIDSTGSTLVLPTVPPRFESAYLDVPPAGPSPDSPVEVTRSVSDWSVARSDSATTFNKVMGHSEFQPNRDDLTYDTDQTWSVSVEDDDPASTVAKAHSRLGLSRPGWSVVVDGSLEMTADDDQFHLAIELSAAHDGNEVWRRTWEEAIPRVWA